MTTKPEVATNRAGGSVAQAIAGYWQHWLDTRHEPPQLAVASAYFNPGGFKLLADQLERSGHVRLLLGAEPDVAADMRRLRALSNRVLPEEDPAQRLRQALRAHHEEMRTDRNLLNFDRGADELVERLIVWLRSGRVQVRRLESRFLHGKAFIVETDHDGVLAGSSNFTYAGLCTNVELNLGHYQPYVVGEVIGWFDDLWDEAVDYDLAGLYEERFREHNPYIVFLRMLWERYRDELDREEEPPGLALTAFQRDGLYRAVDFLDRYNGVLIADGVGLGKSFLGGELLRRATHDRRQRALLIAPASLRDGPWEQFLRRYDLKNVQAVSFQQVAMDTRLGDGEEYVLWHDPDEYAMVVIDEAHNYRNTDTERSATLRQLLKGAPQKQVVLLTATPVNNSLWDLYNLLAYFIRNDAEFLPAGIPSLRGHFAEASAEAPDDLTPDKLFDVLDAVAVRRTRRFIKRYYEGTTVPTESGGQYTITFPQPEVRRVDYDVDDQLPGFFERFAYALGVDPDDPDNPLPDPDAFIYGEQLTLARYAPSVFALEENADSREIQAAGLLRSGLLKRFESSAYAFARTCRTMAASHDVFLDALDGGWVLTGDALAAFARTDTDEFDPATIAGGGKRAAVEDFDAGALREAVKGDRDLLLAFADEAEQVDNAADPKLHALVDTLADIAAQAQREAVDDDDERDKRKVLIFSYYADTVDWIRRHLHTAVRTDDRLAAFRDRVTFVTGNEGDKEDAMFGFAPVSAQAPAGYGDKYDILIATDVLAEGVNLQQARNIINFDLPWNPMRLVQRHGRIDRIGSPHAKVFLRCFFPAKLLDDLLGLEAVIQRKITQAAKSIGVEGEIVPGSQVRDQNFAHTREQITAIQSEDAQLFEEADESGALSGEEFRRELTDAMKDPSLRDQVEHLPWVAGSGRNTDSQPGFVFCAKVGDHPAPMYRWVPTNQDGAPDTDAIAHDTLTCLSRATCSMDTIHHLPDATRQVAYEAWDAARSSILDRWLADADPRNLQPPIPKAMRDAADLLNTHPPAGMETERLYRLIDTIQAPYDFRTQRLMRQAIDSNDAPTEQVKAIVGLVDELGLQPPGEVEPLPEIAETDIHLVCWMALVNNGP